MNVDADVIWLRIIARMRVIAVEHPALTEIQVRVAAERAHHLASVGGDFS